MDDKERANKAEKALVLIQNGLAMLEEAAYENKSESGDDLFWAVDRYNEAHNKACEEVRWNDRGERIPSLQRAIRLAAKDIREG